MFNSCHTNPSHVHYLRVNLTHAHLFFTPVWWRVCCRFVIRLKNTNTQEARQPEIQPTFHAGTLDIYTLLTLLRVQSSTELLGSCRANGTKCDRQRGLRVEAVKPPAALCSLSAGLKTHFFTRVLKSIRNASDVAMAMSFHDKAPLPTVSIILFFFKIINPRWAKRTIWHSQ